MKCASGSLPKPFALSVVIAVLGAASARAQEPAPAAPSGAEVAAPPPAAAPEPPAAPPPSAADAAAEAKDDEEDDDDKRNANGPRQEEVTSVSPQASGFDGDAWGDDGSQMNAGPLSFRLALQTRYRETWPVASGNMQPGIALREDVLAQEGDGFKLQRFLMRMAVTPVPWLSFKGTLDFAKLRGSNVDDVVKQALATLACSRSPIRSSSSIRCLSTS
jgi:hypothetical protein